MFEAVYPTCLVNFLKTLTFVSINFTMFGGGWVSGFVDENNL